MSRRLPWVPNKREGLARLLRRAGVMPLLERAGRRPGLLVLTYHRIGDPSTSLFYDPVTSATPEAFREQVSFLRDRFRILTLDELIALAGAGLAVTEPSTLITFDDGYRDNFDAAWPILRSLGIPAAFFIPTGFLEDPRLPWWDHVAYVIKRTEATRIVLDEPQPLTIDLAQGTRAEAIATLIGLMLDGQVANEPRFRRHLEERTGMAVDDQALGRSLFMSWEQVRTLADAGLAIGSHSHTHHRLAALPEEEQRRELAESKQILEQALGREIRALAYPYGWPGTYNDLTKRLARAVGYRLAFSARAGVNRPGRADPFELRRVAVGFGDSPELVRARTTLFMAFGASFL